ncbi:MAG: hypothetical protein P8Y20_06465 [Gammaproteobacteria bacterium]|jgi:hypothetical protein
MSEKQPSKTIEKSLGLAFLLLLVFASPLMQWWSSAQLPWFTPFLFWLIIILLTAYVNRPTKHDDL